MTKILIVDQEKCTGCRLCELVCSVKHVGVSNPSRARLSIVKWEAEGYYLPMICQHCEKAPCKTVCPKDAIYHDEELNRVMIDYDLCIGCRMCVAACPFGSMGFDTKENKVIKCDMCDGEPLCVNFCDMKAVDYVDAGTVTLKKKRMAGKKLSMSLKQVNK